MEMAITGFLQAAPAQPGQAPATGGAAEGEFPEMLAEVSAEGAIGQLEAILAEFVRWGNETEGSGERTEVVQPGAKAEDWDEKLNIVAAEALGLQQIAIPVALDGATTNTDIGTATDVPEPVIASLFEQSQDTDTTRQADAAGASHAAEPESFVGDLISHAPHKAVPFIPPISRAEVRPATPIERVIASERPAETAAPTDAPTSLPPTGAIESVWATEVGARPVVHAIENAAPLPVPTLAPTRLQPRAAKVERKLTELLQKAGVEPEKASAIVSTVRAFVETGLTTPTRITLEMLVAKLADTNLPQPMKEALNKIAPKAGAVNADATPLETASAVETARAKFVMSPQSGAALENGAALLLGKPQQNSQMFKLSLTDAVAIADQAEETAQVSFAEHSAAISHQFTTTQREATVSDLPKTLSVPSIAGRVIEQVQKWMDDDRSKSITIRLDPPELGSLNVTVRTLGSRVETTILASSGEVRAWLENNRSDLFNALAKNGLELGSMSVGAESRQHSQAQRDESALRQPIWRPEPQPVLEREVFTSQWRRSALDYSV